MYMLIYIATYVVFPDPLGPIIAFIPGLIMALKEGTYKIIIESSYLL